MASMRPAIATVCSLEASLGTILEGYAAGHVDAVDLWLGHASAFLEKQGTAALKDRLAAQGIAAVAASFQGGCSRATARPAASIGAATMPGSGSAATSRSRCS